jgi:hypothetical protein
MHVTDDFASAVAVTIPILMLSGTVELKGLADAVTIRTTSAAHASAVALLSFTKQFAQLRASGHGRVDGLISSLRATLADLSPTLATTVLVLPFLWLGVLLLAMLCELWCFLFLSGVTFGSSTALAIFSLVVVAGLMLLLIGTPAVQTLYMAPQSGLKRFVAELGEEAERDVLEGLSEVVTAAAQAGWMDPESSKQATEILESILRKPGTSVAVAPQPEGSPARPDSADPSLDPGVDSAVHTAVNTRRD